MPFKAHAAYLQWAKNGICCRKTDKPIVVYCYTGQTSGFVTAYLNVLGYDVKSLLFGTNGMIYNSMVSAIEAGDATITIWKDTDSHDYEYVTD